MSSDDVPGPHLPDGWPMSATYEQVALLLAVSKSALYYRVRNGMCPCPVRQGGSSRFTRDQVIEMLRGSKPMGTYKRTWSPQSKGGRKGGRKAAKLRRQRVAALAEFDDEATGGAE